MEELAGRPAEPRSAFRRFFLWFALLPVLIYLAAFPLVRARSYAQWCPSDWGPLLDFAFETGHQNADVVVFGDSSAFVGMDPRLVNAQLDIKTIVLPGTIGSLPVTGDLPLRHYLETNRAPRLLVLYFSPWNLDYLQSKNLRPFEGEEMLFRHGHAREVGSYMVRHPVETLLFPLRLYSTFTWEMVRWVVKKEDRSRATVQALGHADDPDPFPPFDATCSLPNRLLNARGMETVQRLAREHETPTTKVMVYLGPIPNCRNAGAIVDRSFAGLRADAPSLLPARYFLSDPNFAHIEPPFVPVVSKLFADALGKRLGINAGVADGQVRGSAGELPR